MFRTALTAFALYGLGFGVGAVLAPDLIYPIFGGGFPDEFTRTIARAHGSLAVGFGVLAWLARGWPRRMRSGPSSSASRSSSW